MTADPVEALAEVLLGADWFDVFGAGIDPVPPPPPWDCVNAVITAWTGSATPPPVS